MKNGMISQQDVPAAILGLAEAVRMVAEWYRVSLLTGALYSITFNALAAGVAKQDIDDEACTAKTWSIALSHAVESLYKYTNARPPSRTLVDPLDAFTKTFAGSEGSALDKAIADAHAAAEKTKDLVAKAGRAAYVGQDALKDRQVPDPGAWGVVKILEGIQKALSV
jgi:dihydroxyacetone kinase